MKRNKMFKIIVIMLALFVIFPISVLSASQSLGVEWNANPTEDNVVGYRVYASRTSGYYDESKVIADITSGLSTEVTLAYGKWYFVVTAYNDMNIESEYSDEIYKKLGVDKPSGFKFTINVTVQVNQ